MSVAPDNIFATDAEAAGVTTISLSTFTVGSAANRAMLAALITEGGTSAPAMHWDTAGSNQAMSLLATSASGLGGAIVYLFGLIAPTSGTKTLTATWTGAFDAVMAAAAFTGADQTGGTTTFAHINSTPDGGTAASKAVTSAVGNYTVGVWGQSGATLNFTTWNQTHWWNTTGSTLAIGAAGSSATGAATVTYTATSGATQLGFVGVDIVAAGGAAGQVAYQPQYQQAPIMAQ